MIQCFGQHWGIVGAPNKPAKRGFKVFVLADGETAYMANFEISERVVLDIFGNLFYNSTGSWYKRHFVKYLDQIGYFKCILYDYF